MMIAEFTAVLYGLFLFSTAVGTQDFVQEFLSLFFGKQNTAVPALYNGNSHFSARDAAYCPIT